MNRVFQKLSETSQLVLQFQAFLYLLHPFLISKWRYIVQIICNHRWWGLHLKEWQRFWLFLIQVLLFDKIQKWNVTYIRLHIQNLYSCKNFWAQTPNSMRSMWWVFSDTDKFNPWFANRAVYGLCHVQSSNLRHLNYKTIIHVFLQFEQVIELNWQKETVIE